MVEMFLVSMLSKLGLDKENICRQLACLKSGVEQDIWLILARGKREFSSDRDL